MEDDFENPAAYRDPDELFPLEAAQEIARDERMEQALRSINDTAMLLGQLFRQLVDNGLPVPYAFQICRDHHLITLRAGLGE
jgi:hypothetical protein